MALEPVKIDSVLYLHGFNSHPDSFKAKVTRKACESLENAPRFFAPQLDGSPRIAYEQANRILDGLSGNVLIVGSSLGGFFATCLAERRGIARIVLINPAVNPVPLARTFVGQDHVNPVSGATVHIEPCFIDELEQLEVAGLAHPERYLVLLGACDELLDHRKALRFYRGARTLVMPTGDHALTSYPELLPYVLEHAGFEHATV